MELASVATVHNPVAEHIDQAELNALTGTAKFTEARSTSGDKLFAAAFNALDGMPAVEIVGNNVDGDGDGVSNEFTIGDMTALAVYMAAQPRGRRRCSS